MNTPKDETFMRKTISDQPLFSNKMVDQYDYMVEAKEFKAKGDQLIKSKKFEQAFKVYELANDIFDSQHENGDFDQRQHLNFKIKILIALLSTAFKLGKFEDAIILAQEGIAVNPNVVCFHLILAKSIMKKHDFFKY